MGISSMLGPSKKIKDMEKALSLILKMALPLTFKEPTREGRELMAKALS